MRRSLAGLVRGRDVSRRRWSAEEASAALKRLDESGLSVREFAVRQGLNAQRLYRWRAQLGTVSAVAPPAFVEIKPPTVVAIEVVLRSGHVVRLHDGFGEETLRRVVAALDGLAARC
jgi:transposase-like protein